MAVSMCVVTDGNWPGWPMKERFPSIDDVAPLAAGWSIFPTLSTRFCRSSSQSPTSCSITDRASTFLSFYSSCRSGALGEDFAKGSYCRSREKVQLLGYRDYFRGSEFGLEMLSRKLNLWRDVSNKVDRPTAE